MIGQEAEIIGVSDHLLQEFPLLIEFARRGVLDLSHVVTRTVPLEAEPINDTLDALERLRRRGAHGDRTVASIRPTLASILNS